MPSKRELVVVLLIPVGVTAVVLTGVPPLTTADQPDPESLVAEADGSVRNTSIAGVRTERLEQPDGTSTVTVSVREEPPDKSRVTTLDTDGVNVSADQRVINGSTLWTYDEEAEEVEITRLDEGYFISETYTFSDDQLRETYEFEYAGTEVVNGHETHVVEMTPPENATAELSLDLQVGDTERRIPLYRAGDTSWVLAGETWWIDTETTYPVKQQLVWEDDDGTTVARATRVYEELETGVTHDSDTFDFDPPADAAVETSSGRDYEHFTDRDTAAAAVPFALPEPELPGFELRAVIVEDRENSTYAGLSYHNGTTSLVVGVIDTVDDRETNNSEVSVLRRDVGRVNGTLYLVDETVWLDWECGGLDYYVTGIPDAERLVNTAESIGCE